MKLKSLYLRNFRNYAEAAIPFSSKLNFIYGENAQGKSNLLEAIHLLITGRSFRTHHLTDLIRFGENAFFLEAHFEKNGVEQRLALSFDGKSKSLVYNATPLPSFSSLLGILNGVILAPEDHELVKGGPASRRHFLDLQLACESPLYLHHLSRYNRAMKHRNLLLRRKQFETIEIWEEQLAESADFLIHKRRETTKELAKEEAITFHQDKMALSYQTSAPLESDIKAYYLNQYTRHRSREADQGNTLYGPHRDDLLIRIEGQEARVFASEGQTRSCVTSLRLAQWGRLKRVSREIPILCIDDIGISLDSNREKILYQQLASLGQVFITSPKVLHLADSEIHFLEIKQGNLQ